ncbi:MAG TPA: hypoxanthine phosphoribosyltransferase [Geobacteraceae bacterium]|nr:hypoxanthine phosphoribosyltransferase [Geobacteraceae bacterium]
MKHYCRSSGNGLPTPVFSKKEIADAVQRLADQINRDYTGQKLCMVVVLKGAFIFAADLARRLEVPVEIDFVKLASYEGTETSGRVEIKKDVDTLMAGKSVLVVEEIVDTGITLNHLIRHLADKRPGSLRVCTLIDKRERRRVAVPVDYAGLICNSGFLVGYGLDYNECCRELEAIYEVADLSFCGGLDDNSM